MPLYDPFGRPATGPISPEDIERAFQESKRQVEENAKLMLESMEKVAGIFEKTIDKIDDKLDRQREKAKQNFEQMALTLGQGVVEVMSRSLKAGMPGIIGDIQPLFGKAGENIGGSAVKGILGMLGKGGIWGTVAQIVGGQIVKEVGMQVEGFQMIGARVAPTATAGLRSDVNFDRLGASYTRAIRDISRSTGATKDEVGELADKLSKVGIGFMDGSQKEVQFALATERVMNLNKGTASSLQTDMVKNYGESLKTARRSLQEMRDTQREFIAINWQTNSSITRTLSSGQNLIDLLGQITSAGRNSGASLQGMNTIAASLVKTMATQPGGPMFRPGQMAEVGGNIMQTIMPSASSTMADEAQKSKLDQMIMSQTPYSRKVMEQIQTGAPDYLQGTANQGFLFNMQQQQYAATGGRQAAMKIALAKLSGVHNIFEQNKGTPERALAFLEQRGMQPSASIAANQIMEQLEATGFDKNDPRSQERAFKSYLKSAQNDPRSQAALKQAGLDKGILDTAREQGDAMLSTMERVANTLMDVRLWAHNYWANWKDATSEVFGLKKNSSYLDTMKAGLLSERKVAPEGMSGAAMMGSQARFGFTPGWAKPQTAAAPNPVSTSRMVLDRGTSKANDFEMATRDVNVKPR